MTNITDYAFGISAIDSHYQRPIMDAIHLIVEGDRAALVDTGTAYSVPYVLDALRQKGLRPEQVDYILLTHVHLDHAGGAGALAQVLPNARVTAHPRGARHMIDPEKLLAGTRAVYGEAETYRLYGDLAPIPKQRVIETPHQTVLTLNGREFLFLDTPGHARHHACIVDRRSGHIFSGDTFGLSYREMGQNGQRFIFPTTTPIQFDPDALHRSIDLLLSFEPEAIFVTHYSQVRDVERHADDLHRLIDAHVALARRAKGTGPERHAWLKKGLTDLVLEEADRHDSALPQEQIIEVWAGDIELNAQGLGVWLDSRG